MVGVLHVVIQFPLYEVLKTNLAARHVGSENPEELSPVELIAASAISKMVASTGACRCVLHLKRTTCLQ